jgi:hypothetical protein
MQPFMPSTSSCPARSSGVPVRKIVAIILLALVAAVAVAIAVGRSRWHVRPVDVRFVDHREKVAGGGAALNVTGYLVVRMENHHDIFKMARDENSYPEVQATACETGRPLGAWRDPLPLERDETARRFVYAVLIPARHHDVEPPRGDVCLRFVAVGARMSPWAQSRTVAVALPPEVRDQLDAYARRKGTVDLTLDTVCAPRLCQPE